MKIQGLKDICPNLLLLIYNASLSVTNLNFTTTSRLGHFIYQSTTDYRQRRSINSFSNMSNCRQIRSAFLIPYSSFRIRILSLGPNPSMLWNFWRILNRHATDTIKKESNYSKSNPNLQFTKRSLWFCFYSFVKSNDWSVPEKSKVIAEHLTDLHGLFPSTVSWVNYSSYVLVYGLSFLLLPCVLSTILLFISHRFSVHLKGQCHEC